MSIELPATSRHRRDMTERLLKATLSPNQTNKQTNRIWRKYCLTSALKTSKWWLEILSFSFSNTCNWGKLEKSPSFCITLDKKDSLRNTFFLILHENIQCWYSLEVPHWGGGGGVGGSNECFLELKKIYIYFSLLKIKEPYLELRQKSCSKKKYLS